MATGEPFDAPFDNATFVQRAKDLVTPDMGKPAFTPLDMQRRLAQLLAEHKRVVAIQPTGAGKTLAAALPFAAHLLGPSQPGQMVFTTPMRSLTSAQARTLTERFYPDKVARSLGLSGQATQPWVRQQTGTVPDDPDFEAVAAVATFDQALSSALRISYSASKRRRTVNAGAILGSYLVADELHLFPRGEALTTLLCMLNARPPDLPFLLMTATLTPVAAKAVAEALGATVFDAPLSPDDIATLRVADRTRVVRWQAEPLSAEQIAQTHTERPGDRILVVVNTVQRAVDLACDLERRIGRERLTVLHARFYQEHRGAHEQAVKAAFGKDGRHRGEMRVAVATQVIEVGLDISAERIFTELAPANALVQRWGRSARWGGEAHIVIAPPSLDHNARVYPYTSKEEQGVLANTRAWLEQHASGATGIIMGGAEERALLDAAHSEADARWADELDAVMSDRASAIGQAVAEGDYGLAGSLIRHVDTRTVLICGKPDTMLTEPYGMEGFSLAPGSLMPLLPEKERVDRSGHAFHDDDEGEGIISLDLPADARWALRYPVWSQDVEGSEAKANTVAQWIDVTRRTDISTQPVLVVHPSLVAYDDFFGLSLKADAVAVPEGFWAQPVERHVRQKPFNGVPRQSETYAQHIERMLDLYERHPVLGPRLTRIAPTVEAWLGWPAGMLDTLVRAAIVAHDAGKLSPAWQAGITTYQRAINQPMRPWLVHTDDPQGKKPPWNVPPHALSGAAHSLPVGAALDATVIAAQADDEGPLPSNVLFTAIATHHTPNVRELLLRADELLDAPAIVALNQLLSRWSLPGEARVPVNRNLVAQQKMVDQLTMTNAKNSGETFALALVIRMLRLADSWSQDPVRLKEVNARTSVNR